jgi:hypothetical protein
LGTSIVLPLLSTSAVKDPSGQGGFRLGLGEGFKKMFGIT